MFRIIFYIKYVPYHYAAVTRRRRSDNNAKETLLYTILYVTITLLRMNDRVQLILRIETDVEK